MIGLCLVSEPKLLLRLELRKNDSSQSVKVVLLILSVQHLDSKDCNFEQCKLY